MEFLISSALNFGLPITKYKMDPIKGRNNTIRIQINLSLFVAVLFSKLTMAAIGNNKKERHKNTNRKKAIIINCLLQLVDHLA